MPEQKSAGEKIPHQPFTGHLPNEMEDTEKILQ
jgi:hypothetical protein